MSYVLAATVGMSGGTATGWTYFGMSVGSCVPPGSGAAIAWDPADRSAVAKTTPTLFIEPLQHRDPHARAATRDETADLRVRRMCADRNHSPSRSSGMGFTTRH